MPTARALRTLAVAALTVLVTAGCVTPPAGRWPDGWDDDDLRGLGEALQRQCALRRPPPPWPALCPEALAAGDRMRDWLARRFEPRPLVDDHGDPVGLVTGYHEPELSGSRRRESVRQVALYRRPSATFLAARPSRAEIERNDPLAGSEIAWLDDPVEAFFLHVQGSGRIRLRDGTELRVGYAGDNGQPYRAIGATLIERNALPAASVDGAAIKRWLRSNPEQAADVMRTNPRYIFFRELPPTRDDAGPPGALGAALTPLRSVAADPARVPPGSLLWLETTWPGGERPLRRLVVAQDTGAAIRGAVRFDLFFGRGDRATHDAGAMKQPARAWLLTPRHGD